MIFLNGRYSLAGNIGAIFFCSLLCFLVPANVYAVKLDVFFSQSYESSSNVLHAYEPIGNGGYEDTIKTSSVNFKLNENSVDLKSSLELELSYLDYEKNLINDTSRNSLGAELLWVITPGHYSWYFEDNFTQTRIKPLESFSEENIQDVNVFITGPKFEWELGVTTLYLDSSISNFDYSESDNDSTSVDTSLRWGRAIAGGMMLSLNYSTKFLSFDESDVLSDYDQSSFGVGYEYKRSVDSLDMSFGKTILNSDNVTDREYENASLLYERKLTRLSFLSFIFSKKISDQNDATGIQGTVLTNVFLEDLVGFKYHKIGSDVNIDLSYEEKNKSDSVSSDTDDSIRSSVAISRVLVSGSLVRVVYSDVHTQFNTNGVLNFEDNLYESRLEYKKRFNSKLSFLMFVSESLVRSSDIIREYTDTRVGVSLSLSR